MRSQDRAQELGEVFTHKREIDAMLSRIPDMFEDIHKTFLEPSCGDGNFLVEILSRKILSISGAAGSRSETDVEFELLVALSTIYAVDISEVNILEARDRMIEVLLAAHAFSGLEPSEAFADAARAILVSNVVLGDAINSASEIILIEYITEPGFKFRRTHFHLETPEIDLFYVPPKPLSDIVYWELR